MSNSNITNFAEYQRLAMRTAKAMPTYQDDLHHAALGIAGEAGEFADAVKRFTIYGKNLDTANAIEELGDLLWYIALAANSLETSMEDIARANITKLKVRYPEKYTDELAVARLDKTAGLQPLTGVTPTVAIVDQEGIDPNSGINWQNLPKNPEGNKVAAISPNKSDRPIPIYDLMVDIETLSLEDSAVILQIAAIGKFKYPSKLPANDIFNSYLDKDSQLSERTVSQSTVDWWQQQNPDVLERVSSGTVLLRAALEQLSAFIYTLPVPTTMIRFVSKGDFDFRVLEHAYKQVGIEVPWKYWQVCNMRPLLSTFPQITTTKPVTPHDALSDCAAQLVTLDKINELVASVNKQVLP